MVCGEYSDANADRACDPDQPHPVYSKPSELRVDAHDADRDGRWHLPALFAAGVLSGICAVAESLLDLDRGDAGRLCGRRSHGENMVREEIRD